MNEPIYCIGDSHITVFTGRDKVFPKRRKDVLPWFKTYSVGAATAYNLCEENTKSQGRKKLFEALELIPKGSKVMLVFGEIDCRVHLLYQSEVQQRPLELVVEECVSRYFEVVRDVRSEGFEVLVFGVVPSTVVMPSGRQQKKYGKYPVYGSCGERNRVTKMFNEFLEQECARERIKFVSVFDELVDENMHTKEEYFFDTMHLSQKAMPLILKKLCLK